MKKNESFAGRFLLLCGSNVLLQIMGFLYRILLSRYAGPEGLGVYRLSSSIYAILHATCLSGITLAGTRFSSAWKVQHKEGAVRILVRYIFLIFVFLFLTASSSVWFGRTYIGEVLIGDRRAAAAIPVILVCLFLTGIENVFKSVMIGLDRIDHAVVSELTEQAVRIFAAIILLEAFQTENAGRISVLIFSASVVSEIFSASIMTGMYLRMHRPKLVLPPIGYRKEVCKTVFPVSVAALCNNLISSAGAVLLPKRLTASGMSTQGAVSELGRVTGVAAPIITLPLALVASLCTVTLPEVSARFHCNDPRKIRDFSEKILRTVGLIAFPFTALLLPLAPVISRLFFYQPIDPKLFYLMGISCIFCYYQIVLSCFLNGCGQQGKNAVIVSCGELLQLALVWILTAIPKLRIYGYIIAQCAAPIVVCSCIAFVLYRNGIICFRVRSFLLEPAACGLLLFLWTRIFFMFYSGFCGQWAALLLTLSSSLVLYLLVLGFLGIDLRKYLMNTVPLRTFRPMFY